FYASALATTSVGDIAAAGRRTEGRFPSFVVQELTGAAGALLVCGDGYVDPGEQCDFGTAASGGCCSTACQSAPDGDACSDGSVCTASDTCKQGQCVGGPALPCEPCGTCDPVYGCSISDLPFTCRTPTESNRAMPRLANRRGSRSDALHWQWRSGAATKKWEFGDPRTSTGYALCVYGEDPDSP